MIKNYSAKLIHLIKHPSFYRLVFLAICCITVLNKISSFNKHDEEHANKFVPVVSRIYSEAYTPVIKLSGFTKSVNQCILAAICRSIVKSIEVKQGRKVRKGDLLLVLQNDEIEYNFTAAQSNYEQRVAEHKAAEQLTKKKFYSDNSLLAAKSNLDKAKYELQKAQSEAESLKIKAPEDGYLEECFVRVGDVIFPQEKLIKFVSDDVPYVRVYVPEDNIHEIKHGMKAKVKIIDKIFDAKVIGMSNSATDQTHNFYLDLALEGGAREDLSRAGYTAYVDIFLSPRKGFWVNASAIALSEKDEIGIKLIDAEGKVSFQKVDLYVIEKNGFHIEIDTDYIDLVSYGGDFLKVGEKPKIQLKDSLIL